MYRDMIAKNEGRWTPDLIARIPTVQMVAIYAPENDAAREIEILKKVNAIRDKKGLPPMKRLTGRG